MKNKHTVRIDRVNSSIPVKILLQKFCLLRHAEKVGDIETINNTQLGRLRYHNVQITFIQ